MKSKAKNRKAGNCGKFLLSNHNGLNKDEIGYFGFHVQLIALRSQANTHGALLVSGLQGEQVYFIFFRYPSTTDATVLSSRSIRMVSNCRADWGHCLMHLLQPLHLSVSIVM